MFLLPLHLVGCSHEDNPAPLVGAVRFSPEETDALLCEVRRQSVEAVVLSTCHRTELYWWGEADLAPWFAGRLHERAAAAGAPALRVERADADLAVRHLFAVASGLRSVRFGEPEILGQVRRAWMAARAAGTAHGPLDGAFRHAIEAARRVRATAMPAGSSPTLGARVRDLLARERAARATRRPSTVLVVGAGDAARGVLEALAHHPIPGAQLLVSSRTDAKGAALATRFGAQPIRWHDRLDAIRAADAVVFAVHVTTPLLSTADAMPRPGSLAPPLWVDLGVPGAVAVHHDATHVHVVPMAAFEDDGGAERTMQATAQEQRAQRATRALQRELARFAQATRRSQLGTRLGQLEEQAVALASARHAQPVDDVARAVTRFVLRELSRI